MGLGTSLELVMYEYTPRVGSIYMEVVETVICLVTPRVDTTFKLRRDLVRCESTSGERILVNKSATLFLDTTKTQRTTLFVTC